MDWLELVYLNSKSKLEDNLTLNIYRKDELFKSMLKEEKESELSLKEKLDKIEEKEDIEIRKKINWEYKYKTSNNEVQI